MKQKISTQLVKMGVSFKELAKQVFTDTALRNNGGSLGFITWGDTDPNFESVAYSLKVGEVSRPVKTAEGYSIIKVDDRIEDPFTTENEFVNRKHKLERTLKIDKKLPYEKAYLERVFDTSKVKFNEKALGSCLQRSQESQNNNNIESNHHSLKRFQYLCAVQRQEIFSEGNRKQGSLKCQSINRNLVTDVKRLKAAVLGLLMQDVLLDIAKDKGYDTTSYVAETFDNLANNIYLNYKRNEVLALVPVADSEVARYYTTKYRLLFE